MMWRRDGEQVPDDRAEGVREMAQDGEVTVVGQGARLEGTIVSAGSLRIDGQVKGQVNADGDVMLSPQSQVEADINAENVIVAGRFKGNIVVKGKAELARGGRVDGNITSKTLVVQEGGIFCGQSNMDGGTSPGGGSQAGAAQAATATATAESSAQPASGGNGSGGKHAETEPARGSR
jgi:cytoskeletal protein CcmA (bactofilin family)